MANAHPNVSLIRRKKRRGIYAKVNFNGETWETKAGDDEKTATRSALLLSQDLELVRRGLKSLAEVRGDSKKVSAVELLVGEFEKSLKDIGVTEFHRKTQMQRIRDLIAEAKVERLSGDYGRKVLGALVRMRDAGMAAQTLKHYRQAVRQFENWMVSRGHVTGKSISDATSEMRINVAADRRHRRRVWTNEELTKLLNYLSMRQQGVDKARAEGTLGLYGSRMEPKDRATLYEFAIATMLRANEIRSLTPASLKLDGDKPLVVLKAENEKARRGARQQLPLGLVDRLRELSTRNRERLFKWMPASPAKMLRRDIQGAGVVYKTEDGSLDFHAFRHTGAARLVAMGKNIKIVQAMMRHGSINLTLDTYGHLMPGDERDAVESGYVWVSSCSPFCSPVQAPEVRSIEKHGEEKTEVPNA